MKIGTQSQAESENSLFLARDKGSLQHIVGKPISFRCNAEHLGRGRASRRVFSVMNLECFLRLFKFKAEIRRGSIINARCRNYMNAGFCIGNNIGIVDAPGRNDYNDR